MYESNEGTKVLMTPVFCFGHQHRSSKRTKTKRRKKPHLSVILQQKAASIYRRVPTSTISLLLTEISTSKQLTVKTPHIFLTSQHYIVSAPSPVDS